MTKEPISELAERATKQLAEEIDKLIISKYKQGKKYLVFNQKQLIGDKFTIEYVDFTNRQELDNYLTKNKETNSAEILDLTKIDQDPELQARIEELDNKKLDIE